MTRQPFTVAHLSMFQGAPTADVADYVAAVIAHHTADIVTTTECRRKAKAIRAKLGDGFAVASIGEHCIIWRRARFSRWPGTITRSRAAYAVPWFTRGGSARTFRVLQRDLRDKATGHHIRVQTAHCPSHVEHGDQWRTDTAQRRVTSAREGFRQWGKWVRTASRRKPGLVHVLTMDANLDQRRDAWRTYLTDTLGLPSVWEDGRWPYGTHGNRVIDTAHSNAPTSRARRTPVPPRKYGVDHWGIVFDVHP